MAGITTVMNLARNAMSSYQVAMNVTSHNIANVGNTGYSKQTAVLSSAAPLTISDMQLGMGVEVSAITQAFDWYTNQSLLENSSVLSEYETKAQVLSYLEGIFDETNSAGLNQALADFWNAWQDLADNPGGTTERSALLSTSETLISKFHSMSEAITKIMSNMNINLNSGLSEVNQLTSQIAQLNEKIVAIESDGTTANDLRDQRNTLLGELSNLLDIDTYENENGSITVQTSGILLVDGNRSWSLSQVGDNIYYNGIASDVSSRLSGGKIGAWLDIRDEIAPQYLANLDELAGTLIEEVNTIHYAGYDLSGASNYNFFEALPTAGVHTGAAASIQLSTHVDGNPDGIAAGGLSGSPGDNENALEIVNLQTDDTISVRVWSYQNRGASITSTLQTTSFEDYYSSLVGDLGILTAGVNQNQEFTQSLVDNLTEIRNSISGVSLDEEMTELLKIQQAYQALSKVISMADEMMQSLLAMA